MYNFPRPYKDELVYSMLARARVKYCITSPKQLIQSATSSRSTISSVQFPCRAEKLVVNNLSMHMSSEQMIMEHTLFPLYAPFIPKYRNEKCKQSMQAMSHGIPYLSTGYNASRLPKLRGIRYCPDCIAAQGELNGEPYWMRTHQIVGLDTCIKHRANLETVEMGYGAQHRHEYFPVFPSFLKQQGKTTPDAEGALLAPKIAELLNSQFFDSPTYEQWTSYYRERLSATYLKNGRHTKYQELKGRVKSLWSSTWLRLCNLDQLETETSWLHGISRKHRKSFSYLEHIVCLSALFEKSWSIKSVIEDATQLSKFSRTQVFVPIAAAPSCNGKVKLYRAKWIDKVASLGTKLARSEGAGGVYAWLYRYDRSWLLMANAQHKRPIDNKTCRVDWQRRDRAFVKQLVRVRNDSVTDLYLPRQSKQWFIHHLKSQSCVEKNKNYRKKLPLTYLFLEQYQETVPEYQIRRLTRIYIDAEVALPRWQLLRQAGLSDERISDLAEAFVEILYTT
ncbi:MAG: hypothetical protein ACI88A_005339 [Paraglaciecola sp.]